ncbi:MAG: ABC transporter substrate-binding protein [Oscillospiraceae bacterium]|nr:ABC transporter substrate-binding protein [Oscillospiraceae bacterium]MBQ8216756.1 ABC transporter substrate-binding protein [Oscillospiraceae bacterium]
MKKTLAMLLVLCMVVALCPAAFAADEGSVYWLNFKPESDEALQQIAAMYTEETGVEVKVVTAASGTYNQTLTSEMDKSDAPTLFVAGNQAAVDEWADYCYDLTGTPIAEELNTDAYMLYDEDGKLCSIGYCYECYGIITNKALLKEAGYEVSDITNFESLKAVAEDITARKDELGFSAFTSAGMDGSSSWRFTGHLINLEYYYESVDDPEAWTSCPATITGAYMDNYRNLWDLMINNSTVAPSELATGGFDAQAEFANGEAVFYSQGNWEWSGLADKGMKAEDLTMIPYYCGVEGEEMAGLNCGTENYWAVNGDASEEDIQATLDFMYWLVTDAEASRIAVDTFGVMPYTNSAVSTNPFLANANEYASNGHYTMWWATNYQPNVDAYRAAVVSAMNEYNNNPSDETWATVETAFVDGWAVQYQAANG